MIFKARPIIQFSLNLMKMAFMSTNTLQKHQCTMSHHYHFHSDLQNPSSTTALIVYRRTDGVDLGSHWRQFHEFWPIGRRMVLDAFVKTRGMFRTRCCPSHPQLLLEIRWGSQVTYPGRWTSLIAWREPPNSTWNRTKLIVFGAKTH